MTTTAKYQLKYQSVNRSAMLTSRKPYGTNFFFFSGTTKTVETNKGETCKETVKKSILAGYKPL